jgi:hypothetical protein
MDVEKLIAIKFLVKESRKKNLIHRAIRAIGILEPYAPELLRTLSDYQGDRLIAYLNKANMLEDIERRKRKRVHA